MQGKTFLITRRLALHLFLPTEFLSDRFCLPFRALNELDEKEENIFLLARNLSEVTRAFRLFAS